jgi:hypothetical protein
MAVRLSALRVGRRSTLQKHYFSASGTPFCQRVSKPQGLVRPEIMGKLIKIVHLIGSWTPSLLACSLVPSALPYRTQWDFQLNSQISSWCMHMSARARTHTHTHTVSEERPSLWSSGQTSWLLTQRNGFDSRRYQIFWLAVGLKRGPLSLVRIIEELLETKVGAPV